VKVGYVAGTGVPNLRATPSRRYHCPQAGLCETSDLRADCRQYLHYPVTSYLRVTSTPLIVRIQCGVIELEVHRISGGLSNNTPTRSRRVATGVHILSRPPSDADRMVGCPVTLSVPVHRRRWAILILHVGREQTRQLFLFEGHRALLCGCRGRGGF